MKFPYDGISAHIRDTKELASSLSLFTPSPNNVKPHASQEKEVNWQATWSSTCEPPELWKNKFWCLSTQSISSPSRLIHIHSIVTDHLITNHLLNSYYMPGTLYLISNILSVTPQARGCSIHFRDKRAKAQTIITQGPIASKW